MNKNLQNKLKTYSALTAVAVVSASSAEAQINATTVNYTGGYESYDIDIDGNGVDDFRITASGFDSGYYWGYGWNYVDNGKSLRVSDLNNGRVLVNFGTYNVKANDADNVISPYGYFAGWNPTVVSAGSNGWSNSSYGSYPSTFAYGDSKFDALDGSESYIAVQFYDDNNDLVNGWMRVSMVIDASNEIEWTLHETAYEEQSGVAAITNSSYAKSYVTTTVKDVANQLNASDALINVAPVATHDFASLPTHAYVMVVKDDGRIFDVNAAMGSNSEEIVLDGSASYNVELNAWITDTDGDLILQNQPYNVFVGVIDQNNSAILRLEDGVPFTLSATVGVEDVNIEDINVYASNKTLTIETPEALNGANVMVHDITGKIILSDVINSTTFQHKFASAEGIYLVSILTTDGKMTTKVKF